MRRRGLDFDEIWLVDFEFKADTGARPDPICLVGREFRSGKVIRIWQDDLRRLSAPPYPTDGRSLFVAYYASAEMGCHLALGWKLPANVLDLFTEFRALTNGLPTPCGSGLLGALAYFGFDALAVTEKEEMRELAMRGGPWSADEQRALLNYCESDVDALAKLLPRMEPTLDFPRALVRGRYMKAAALIEHNGVPIDTVVHQQLSTSWSNLRDHLIEDIDRYYGVFEGSTFKSSRWERWLHTSGIPWPRLASGALALDDETFRQMARAHPSVAPMRELRCSLSQLRLSELAVGPDGRNRCLLSAFRSRTGRNQPSNAKFIFGPAVWLRSLIQAPPGYAVAYLDWSRQEFGIAASLSGDTAMCEAYRSGDPYLALAKQARAVPADATKESHASTRDLYKQCVLGVQYAMGDEALAQRIGRAPIEARELLRLHRETYPTFWRWSDAALDYAMLHGRLWTVFGWEVHTSTDPNPRSIRNFPMQANGAEMLRLACCLATERGVKVCAPVHDAILIEARADELEHQVALARAAMAEASSIVLAGFELRTDAQVFSHPDRYVDARGRAMWQTAIRCLERLHAADGSMEGAA